MLFKYSWLILVVTPENKPELEKILGYEIDLDSIAQWCISNSNDMQKPIINPIRGFIYKNGYYLMPSLNEVLATFLLKDEKALSIYLSSFESKENLS